MTAPLYDSLQRFADSDPLRLHMPGHKGRMDGLFRDASSIDFTELPPTGNLYTGEGPIADAEALFARTGGARDALFFTCGATQGIYTMLAAAVGRDGTLILDRGCHRSVYHGMALLDIAPVYLQPPLLPGLDLPAPVSGESLEQALTEHPEASAVFLTSPSYYGVITDLRPLAEICRRHSVFLLVDQAHGAHFPFAGLPTAVEEGADLAVVSAHKTLPALGSSSILYAGHRAPWDRLRLKSLAQIFATTSPSYPILASIDLARASLEGTEDYRDAAALTREFRDRIRRETPFRPLTEDNGISLDPCRLTVDTAAGGLSGTEADRLLREKNIYVEMADPTYLVAIITCRDTRADLERFLAALKVLPAGAPLRQEDGLPPAPVVRQRIRTAVFGPAESVLLGEAAGRISAQFVAPYPPGIPVIAPGEEITEKHIAYLKNKSYNVSGKVSVIPQARKKEDLP